MYPGVASWGKVLGISAAAETSDPAPLKCTRARHAGLRSRFNFSFAKAHWILLATRQEVTVRGNDDHVSDPVVHSSTITRTILTEMPRLSNSSVNTVKMVSRQKQSDLLCRQVGALKISRAKLTDSALAGFSHSDLAKYSLALHALPRCSFRLRSLLSHRHLSVYASVREIN